MGKTAYQKIVESHLLEKLSDGRLVLKTDINGCHEITTPTHIMESEKYGYDVVCDPNKIVAMIDHVSPSKDAETARQADIMRNWSKKHDITFFDIGDNGICHALIPEKVFIRPGETGIMGDSHTCTWGAVGALSVGVGTTALGSSLTCGFFLLKPQKVIRVNFKGPLPSNVYAKDLALLVVKHFGKEGAKNCVLEFYGDAVKSMAGRFTISNMSIEAGATCGMWPVDRITVDYLWPALKNDYQKRSDALRDLVMLNSDPDSQYDDIVDIDVSDLRPVTTFGYHPSNVKDVWDFPPTKIDQVVIGSCTNGRIEDLRLVAGIFKEIGKKVKVPTIIIPATPHIYQGSRLDG